ncbi:MAG: phosphoribosylglycinamide formyltransferase [Melioribacteraceae bacterium]|nr:phosphoribosylglycinamide formyltransferase [Melioribacteraceae bacterium]MCF8355540.1 phosphoribosylglycinamide formyltransferase [Melioribacteraceae bacterium]MCF8394505.1 phosphoribosylglycinamide formyltransferase [Melioribacteraceae bacterium]MCF8420121.1 phosphoribosylglycinamide formyltransferase [Melioribacteraceae bacterium]
MLNIAVFVSGRGSNLKAILNSQSSEKANFRVSTVISNKIDCPAIEYSKKLNIPVFAVKSNETTGYISWSDLLDKFNDLGINFIVLAGFLKKIPDIIIDNYDGRIINIHPALLPAFGGKGMYGMNVHQAVFDSSVQISGPTIHFVNKVYDDGKIIAQRTVDISDVKSPEEIAERVLILEHELLPFIINKFAENKVRVVGKRVFVD